MDRSPQSWQPRGKVGESSRRLGLGAFYREVIGFLDAAPSSIAPSWVARRLGIVTRKTPRYFYSPDPTAQPMLGYARDEDRGDGG
jgi:hypothetical protein